jgi:uncharacterized protein DUF1707
MTLVGDADRDRALALLRRHYAEGRLDPEELKSRVGVAATARSTADVRIALRGLPNATIETAIAPRILAARSLLGGAPALRRAGRVALAAIVSALWACATLSLLIVFGILALVSGLTLLTLGAFAVCWLLVTLASWRLWRRGSLPFRHRGG